MKNIQQIVDEKLCDYCMGSLDEEIQNMKKDFYKLGKVLVTSCNYIKYWHGNLYLVKCPVCGEEAVQIPELITHANDCELEKAEKIIKEYEEERND